MAWFSGFSWLSISFYAVCGYFSSMWLKIDSGPNYEQLCRKNIKYLHLEVGNWNSPRGYGKQIPCYFDNGGHFLDCDRNHESSVQTKQIFKLFFIKRYLIEDGRLRHKISFSLIRRWKFILLFKYLCFYSFIWNIQRNCQALSLYPLSISLKERALTL